jgi:hypothetical protein
MAMSHATCTHPRTPAGRRACRAGTPSPAETAVKVELGADTPDAAAMRRARGTRLQNRLMAMADAPVTRAPKPNLVIRTPENCVQAELHKGSGRCACGWSA